MSQRLNVMDLFEELERIPKPTLYQRKGKECYLDPYREKLIPASVAFYKKGGIFVENFL